MPEPNFSRSSPHWLGARATIRRWRDDPDAFVREVLNAAPEAWQSNALKDIAGARRVAIRSGHGVGKSTMLSWLILWFLATRYPAKVPCTAPTGHQLYDVLWAELATWHRKMIPALREQFEWKTERFELKSAPNESFAVARTARKEKPEAFQGFHSDNLLFVVDEASGVDDIIFETGASSMSTPGAKTVMGSNPTRNSGYFREAFGRQREHWHGIHVSCMDSSRVDPAYAQDMESQYGRESDIYRVRVLGEFPHASSMQFISMESVEAAEARDAPVHLQDPFIIGVDVARFGDDRSVICLRKGRDARVHQWVKLRGVDTMTLAARVAEEWRRYNADGLFVDEGGVGGGVVDRLRQLNIPVIGVNFGAKADRITMGQDGGLYANKRAEMWGNMRDWLKGGAIPDDPELKADLTGVEYGYNAHNEIQLERKEDMKKRGLASPDLADALALTFAYPVEAKSIAGGLQSGPLVQTEFDPYA